MARRFLPKVVLGGVESTYGTDIIPTAALEMEEGSTIEPLVATKLEHRVARASFGNYLKVLVGKYVKMNLRVAMAGSGTVDTAAAYAWLLRICALAQTITATVKVEYTPVDLGPSNDSASIYFYADGSFHKVLGCRANLSWNVSTQNIVYLEFEVWGLYVGPVTGSLPTPDLSAFQKPIAISNANTTYSLHGISPVLVSHQFNLGNKLQHRDAPGEEAIRITDRMPSGSIGIDAPPLATKDFFATVVASTVAAENLTHGTVPGNIVMLDAPNVQLEDIAHGDNDGILGYPFTSGYQPGATTSNDEVKITTQ